jgi:colanic acid biosynthesis glycosyl transferase WcaI
VPGYGDEFQANGGIERVQVNPEADQMLGIVVAPIAASVPLTGTAAKAVQKSGGGVVIPPEDEDALAEAILDLYNHPEKRAALSAKGRQYAIENYAYEQALNRYESLFSELVEENTYRLKALSK